ncbi:MAG TPA: T9SS type A sorting domain-containing protein [Bacteroidia bacterium]|nr:T9SS type A sorting domain-containing protein [Bacteroidia bacterium]
MKKIFLLSICFVLNMLVGYAQPTNIDFNAGNINGWTLQEGANLGSTSMAIGSIHPSTQYTVLSSGAVEVNSVPVTMSSPLGGSFVRIGQTGSGGSTYKLTQTYLVDAASANVQFAYALVMDNGGHTCDEQNYFALSVKDVNGNTIPANTTNQSVLNGTSCSSGDPSYMAFSHFNYKNWSNLSYDLSSFVGTQVTIELLVSGCIVTQGAHAGYAYFDASFCSNSNSPSVMSANTNTYSLLSSQNTILVCGTTTANIVAPPGASSYSWTGTGITGLTTQSVLVTQAGTYQLVFDKPTACSNTTSVTIKVGDTPTVAITAASGTLCAYSGITLSASGASAYVWAPYASNSSGNFSANNTVYPQSSTIYTVTGTNTFGCSASAQYSVVTAPSPSLSITGNTLICPGNSASLTVSGADTYSWSTGVTTTSVVLTPTANTSYNVKGFTTSTGCSQTLPFTVAMDGVISYSPSILRVCIGDSLTISTSGAISYTWSTGANTNTISVKPVTTTAYTLDATTACGIKQSIFTVTVNPLPNVPITQITPAVCGGVSASFATTSGLQSYTWSTGSTTYNTSFTSSLSPISYTNAISVKALTSSGCTNTSSTVYTVFPVPTISTSITNDICTSNTATLSATGASNYTWTPGNLTGANVTISPTAGTVYSVNGKDVNGCSNTSTVAVGVSTSTVISASISPSVICEGGTASLTAVGNGIFKWYKSDTTSQVLSMSLSYVTPTLSAGTYTYYISSTCNSPTRVPVIVNVLAKPIISVAATSTTVCKSTPFQLFASGANTYTTYVSPVSYNDTITVTQTLNLQTYYVNGTGINGCTNTGSINIALNPSTVSITPAGTNSVCKGASKTFSLVGASTYTWSNGVVGMPATFTPTASTNYSVSSVDSYGCFLQQSFLLSVIPTPTVNLNYSNNLCIGVTYTLSANGAVSYTWSAGSTTSSIITTPSSAGVISVTGTGSNGCTSTASIMVVPLPSLTITTTSGKDTICSGSSTQLTAFGCSNYVWSSGYTTNFMYTNTLYAPQTYTVTGTSSYSGTTCSNTITKTIYVTALPNIVATASPSFVCESSPSILSASGALTYTWTGGISSNSNTVSVVPSQTVNIYTVWGKNAFGCAASYTVEVDNKIMPYPYMTNAPWGFYDICSGKTATMVSTYSADSYTWQPGGMNTPTITTTPSVTTTYTLYTTSIYPSCASTKTNVVNVYPTPTANMLSSGDIDCLNSVSQLTLSSSYSGLYTWSGPGLIGPLYTQTATVNQPGVYSCTISANTGAAAGQLKCLNNASITINSFTTSPTLSLTATDYTICEGSSTDIIAAGASTYSWSTGAITSSINVTPTITSMFLVEGTNSCGATTDTVTITVDNTCQDVWPGDANSDGIADNLDVLELGLHYAQAGASRAVVSNSWQSYFANNWIGTITSGKNVNHSDCNGDGTINDDDTLAIFNNYNLIHAFKPAQTNTFTAVISIIPDQPAVVKGTWGTASVYLGDITTNAIDINGVAFTLDFDNTLIEPNNIYLEYQNSFMDASQNLHFRKLDFANSKLFTASTHTVSNNVSGYGKIATLHYQILSSLTTDEVLSIGISQGYKSDASGTIESLTTSTGTLMALGTSVGVKENLMNGNVFIYPSPTNGLLNINFATIPLNTKIEIYNALGAVVMQETLNGKNNTINISNLSCAVYYMKVLDGNKVVAVKKVVKE